MRPADFDYVRAGDIEHALQLLAGADGEAKVMSGGQSLVPILNMRIARPKLVIDIGRLPEMRYAEVDSNVLRIGATVTHADLELGRLGGAAREFLPVLAPTASLIGHHPIRTRGTFCGSIAHADPASEWCLIAMLFDATMVARSQQGTRLVSAADFIRGFLTNGLREDEILCEAQLPGGLGGASVVEITRRHGDFPIVSAGAAVTVRDGRCVEVRLALGGVSDIPLRMADIEERLRGVEPDPSVLADAAEMVGESLEPPSDIHGSAEFRRHLAKVLTRKALLQAVEKAMEEPAT
jgi:aerobic carbon-monoxide dehydrogenase medium subunit